MTSHPRSRSDTHMLIYDVISKLCVTLYFNYTLDFYFCSENGVLLATDVAARGLDIPNVQHVIHYQVPRTSEVSVE